MADREVIERGEIVVIYKFFSRRDLCRKLLRSQRKVLLREGPRLSAGKNTCLHDRLSRRLLIVLGAVVVVVVSGTGPPFAEDNYRFSRLP